MQQFSSPFTAVLCTALVAFWTGSSQSEEAPAIPEPVNVQYATADGVLIHAAYFASASGKDAGCAILLHDHPGDRQDMASLALALQAEGVAVLTPDLRGHGESWRTPNGADDEAPRLRPADFQNMLADVEAGKRYLIRENNAGRLNIEKLAVTGAGFSAILAANWATIDWSFPRVPAVKQGEDVKALILLRPRWRAQGLNLQDAVYGEIVGRTLAVAVVYAQNANGQADDGQRILKVLQRQRSTGSRHSQGGALLELTTPVAEGAGPSLVDVRVLNQAAKFLSKQLSNLEIPWAVRQNPL